MRRNLIIALLLVCLGARAASVTNLFTGQSLTNGMVITSVSSTNAGSGSTNSYFDPTTIDGLAYRWLGGTNGGALGATSNWVDKVQGLKPYVYLADMALAPTNQVDGMKFWNTFLTAGIGNIMLTNWSAWINVRRQKDYGSGAYGTLFCLGGDDGLFFNNNRLNWYRSGNHFLTDTIGSNTPLNVVLISTNSVGVAFTNGVESASGVAMAAYTEIRLFGATGASADRSGDLIKEILIFTNTTLSAASISNLNVYATNSPNY